MPPPPGSWTKRLLLRVWRDVPFPTWLRRVFLRLLNPAFLVGAMAVIQNDAGDILMLEHTYRPEMPWGLPGGWLKRTESPEAGLAREVFEETGFRVRVGPVLAVGMYGGRQVDLVYRCEIESGTFQPTDEVSAMRWVPLDDLPDLLPNQRHLLRKAGISKEGN